MRVMRYLLWFVNSSGFCFNKSTAFVSLIEYISAYIALDPGDLVITGTPSGVGVFRDPPVFLEPGDIVRCEIERIGRVENRVMDAAVRPS